SCKITDNEATGGRGGAGGDGGPGHGGGIYNNSATLTVVGCKITDNKVAGGRGGAGGDGGEGEGGGVFSGADEGLPADLTVLDTIFRDNEARGGAGFHGGVGLGGGLYLADTTACIKDSSIQRNQADGGHGVGVGSTDG